jgi:hypothetical protein
MMFSRTRELEFERVRVAQLVGAKRRRTPGSARQPAELAADRGADHGRPRIAPSMTQSSGPAGSSSRAASHGRKLLPAPLVHPVLAAATALATAHEDRSAPVVEVVLGERERLLDAQPRPPQ